MKRNQNKYSFFESKHLQPTLQVEIERLKVYIIEQLRIIKARQQQLISDLTCKRGK
jgi:hypothetical protein